MHAEKRAERPTAAMLNGDAAEVAPSVWRGPIFSQHGHGVAYVKRVPDARAFTVEMLCGVLARLYGLPMPRLYAVIAEPRYLSGIQSPANDPVWLCGFEDTGHPSLNRVITDQERVRQCLLAWPQATECGAFDTWIGNADRTSKNLLCAPGDRVVGIIDHGDALPTWLAPDQAHGNALLDALIDGSASEIELARLRKKMNAAALAYGKCADAELVAAAEIVAAAAHVKGLVDWLRARVYHMPDLIAAATRDPQIRLH